MLGDITHEQEGAQLHNMYTTQLLQGMFIFYSITCKRYACLCVSKGCIALIHFLLNLYDVNANFKLVILVDCQT